MSGVGRSGHSSAAWLFHIHRPAAPASISPVGGSADKTQINDAISGSPAEMSWQSFLVQDVLPVAKSSQAGLQVTVALGAYRYPGNGDLRRLGFAVRTKPGRRFPVQFAAKAARNSWRDRWLPFLRQGACCAGRHISLPFFQEPQPLPDGRWRSCIGPKIC